MRILSIATLALSVFMVAEARTEFSDSFCRFLYIWSGRFSADDGNAYVDVAPIKVAGINDPTRYYRERSDEVNREFVLTASEGAGGKIYTQVYDVDGDGKQLKVKDLTHLSGCGAVFEETKRGVFTGEWVDCTRNDKGENPVYKFYASCTDAIYDISVTDGRYQETFSKVSSYSEIPSILSQFRNCQNPCPAA